MSELLSLLQFYGVQTVDVATWDAFVDANKSALTRAPDALNDTVRVDTTALRAVGASVTRFFKAAAPAERPYALLLRRIARAFALDLVVVPWATVLGNLRHAVQTLSASRREGPLLLYADRRSPAAMWATMFAWPYLRHRVAAVLTSAPPTDMAMRIGEHAATLVYCDLAVYTGQDPTAQLVLAAQQRWPTVVCCGMLTPDAAAALGMEAAAPCRVTQGMPPLAEVVATVHRGAGVQPALAWWRRYRAAPATTPIPLASPLAPLLFSQFAAYADRRLILCEHALPAASGSVGLLPMALTAPMRLTSATTFVYERSAVRVGHQPDTRPFYEKHAWALVPAAPPAEHMAPPQVAPAQPDPLTPWPDEPPAPEAPPLTPPPPDVDTSLEPSPPEVDTSLEPDWPPPVFDDEDWPGPPPEDYFWDACVVHPDKQAQWQCSACSASVGTTAARYCAPACQALHWTEGGHRHMCSLHAMLLGVRVSDEQLAFPRYPPPDAERLEFPLDAAAALKYPGLRLTYLPRFIERGADGLYQRIREGLMAMPFVPAIHAPYNQPTRVKYAWFTRTGADTTRQWVFKYSGSHQNPMVPRVPPDWLEELFVRVNEAAGPDEYNAVLINFYEQGEDQLGFHSDAHAWYGATFDVPGFSMGATRPLFFRSKAAAATDEVVLAPSDGSLYVMRGADTQRLWLHGVPKMSQKDMNAFASGAERWRFSFTFRRILPALAQQHAVVITETMQRFMAQADALAVIPSQVLTSAAGGGRKRQKKLTGV